MALTQTIIEKAAIVLQEWANEATFAMQANLQKKGIDKGSMLSQSISFDGTEVSTNGVTVKWTLPEYAVYVDLGVKGLRNEAKVYGNFAFKNMHVSAGFLSNMEEWITRKGMEVMQSKSQTKQDVFDSRKAMAFAMAKSIKKEGLTGTRFYSDVFDGDGFKKLISRLETSLGEDIEITIIKDF